MDWEVQWQRNHTSKKQKPTSWGRRKTSDRCVESDYGETYGAKRSRACRTSTSTSSQKKDFPTWRQSSRKPSQRASCDSYRDYKALFRDVRFKGNMENFIGELMRAKDRLEKGDPETKVSDGIMGYLLLTRCGLAEEEMKHVLGLTGGELKLSAVRRHLVELYPAGSSKRGRHSGYYVEGEEEYEEDVEPPTIYYDE